MLGDRKNQTALKRRGKPRTPAYFFFYILFSGDTWRVLMGVVLSFILMPHIPHPGVGKGGIIVLYLMVAAIGWAITGKPAHWITSALKQIILK